MTPPVVHGLRRIADTVDAVDYVTFCNLANVNEALRGTLLSVLEVKLIVSVKVPHWTMQTRRHSLPSCMSRYSTYGGSGTSLRNSGDGDIINL